MVGCAAEGSSTPGPDSSAQVPAMLAPPGAGPGTYVVMTRPPNVPANYMTTPSGYFDPSCVVEVGANERVQLDGTLAKLDGTAPRPVHRCASPAYDVQGREIHGMEPISVLPPRLEPDAPDDQALPPTINGWISYEDSTTLGNISYLHAQWTVPTTPSNSDGQTVYFFPGLENKESSSTTILQPVLGFNQDYGPAGWSLASWNCCSGSNPTLWHSSFLAVTAGSTVSGDMQGSSCNTTTGVCPNWSIISRIGTAGSSVTLNTTTTLAMDWVFSAVLECYSIDTCNELPASTSDVFSGFSIRNAAGTTLSIPAWGLHPGTSLSPSCSYTATKTATTATLGWATAGQVCTPGDDRACCPFQNGCSCDGDQICKADGSGWGACMGAGQAGHPCP
ncbi:MAG TPA: hypothetical protein VGM88_22335 [Kofleriaceae bacterium]